MNDTFAQSIGTISGTVGLVVALRALVRAGSPVAVAATICPNVVAAIMAADCIPFFVDIERQTFGIDPAALWADIDAVSAVIAVHAAGNPCRILEIAEICRTRGKVLIEDCAQADGAALNGIPVGTWGDASIFSYGRGKIIDLGNGGLLLGRDTAIRRQLRLAAEALPADRAPAEALQVTSDLNTTYKKLYNSGYPLSLAPHRDRFLALLQKVGAAGLARAPAGQWNAIVSAREARLVQTLSDRRRKLETYRVCLANVSGITILPYSVESAPWRCNIALDSTLRDKLLKSMLADEMNVSSWHPDIRPYLPAASYRSGTLAQTDWYTKSILNLWLDDETSESDIHETASEIIKRTAMLAGLPAA